MLSILLVNKKVRKSQSSFTVTQDYIAKATVSDPSQHVKLQQRTMKTKSHAQQAGSKTVRNIKGNKPKICYKRESNGKVCMRKVSTTQQRINEAYYKRHSNLVYVILSPNTSAIYQG